MLLLDEAKRARRGNVGHIAAIGKLDLEAFAADQRMREIDGVADRVAFRGIDADELVAFLHFVGAQDLEINAFAALLAKAGLVIISMNGMRAAVEDGDFEVVELHDGVVDAHADEGRQQVLGGGDEHAFLHQAGGVADLGDVAADGFDFKAVKVGAAKHNARARGGRQDSKMNRGSAMEADAAAFGRIPNCSFVDQ